MWLIVVCCWVLGSVPLALLLGRVLSHAEPALPPDLTAEVDALLDRIFAADAATRVVPRTP